MGFSISDPEADTIKFGEAIVFVSAIFAYFFFREMALMPLDGVVQRNKLYIVSGETLFIKTLPEAQRTQGIEFITQIIFMMKII